jgi:hypothetical protein
VIDISLFIVILIQYSQRHSVINHCDRHITISITMKSDRSITVIYHAMSLTVLYSLNQVKFKVFEKKYILSDSYWISDELQNTNFVLDHSS